MKQYDAKGYHLFQSILPDLYLDFLLQFQVLDVPST